MRLDGRSVWRKGLNINALQLARGPWEESQTNAFPVVTQASEPKVRMDPSAETGFRKIRKCRENLIGK